MPYTIQILQPQDIHLFWPIFVELLKNDFPGYSPSVINFLLQKMYTPDLYRYWIENRYKTLLVARNDDTIYAFAVIDSAYGGVSLCRWLGVKKDYQRQGIGRRLIEAWLELAKKEGCHKAEVAAQPEAKDFYAKAGLTLEGKRDKSYFGIDQYIYGKVIGEPVDDVMTRI